MNFATDIPTVEVVDSLENAQPGDIFLIDSNTQAFDFMTAAGIDPIAQLVAGAGEHRRVRFTHKGRECIGRYFTGCAREADNGFMVLAMPVGVPASVADEMFRDSP